MARNQSEIRQVLVSTELPEEECRAPDIAHTIREDLEELFGKQRPRCDVHRLEEEDVDDERLRRAYLLVIRNANAVEMLSILAALADYEHLNVDDAEYEPDESEDMQDFVGQFAIPELEAWRDIPPKEEPEDWSAGDEIEE